MTPRLGVIAHSNHDQRIAQTGNAQADTTLRLRLPLLTRQGPFRRIEHVVQHAHGHRHNASHGLEVKAGAGRERIVHELRQVEAAEITAPVGGECLLATGVACFNQLAILQVVVTVDRVDEQHSGLGVIVGALHDLLPKFGGRQPTV